MVPDIVPTKGLVSSFTNNNQHIYRDRNSLQVSERHFVPDNSSTSLKDKLKTRPQNEEQEDSFEGFICTDTDI